MLEYTTLANGTECLTKKVGINAGCYLSYEVNKRSKEVWSMIQGEGDFAFEGDIRTVSAGNVLIIPIGNEHGIKANSDLEFSEVQTGDELTEEDIYVLTRD